MRILKTRFRVQDIQRLKERGIVHNCHLRGTPFDEAWNAAYNDMVDINVWFPKDKVPVWMNVRVDMQDGVPWLVNVVFKIPAAIRDIEGLANELAGQFSLSKYRVSISAYHANPDLQSFGSFGRVLQINSSNENPKKLLSFLRALEKKLQAVS
ncbi:MAG: hypothetical protein HYW89_01810 [Candidatus Sungiibacteriota bacterium]|uniref:Uncharacterized protein n=1 Tax=Candidatus Sungiibacteriota bacterium TaxID=2750080 RepID=A0A7T5RK63_9BACT|nr:MAG: hypothetical protein HYW89_01810 [Candidatus Sungbacteria bacterium]